ncbi:hypothetical protein DY968_26720 [Pseudomonas aeruginosa]|nr:hypothetical protein DY968_26720 [Pseudomonas aeruginosa]
MEAVTGPPPGRRQRSELWLLEQFGFLLQRLAQAVELANRHGYNNPFFADICGDLCVLRFRRSSRLHATTTLTLK